MFSLVMAVLLGGVQSNGSQLRGGHSSRSLIYNVFSSVVVITSVCYTAWSHAWVDVPVVDSILVGVQSS